MSVDKKILLLQLLLVLIVSGAVFGADSDAPPQGGPNATVPPVPEQLPPGFVRGDVVSYSYVPIRHWSPKEGIGILPYLFEYNLQEQKDGTPLEAFHDANIRRIDIASQWSTVIMLSARRDEYVRVKMKMFSDVVYNQFAYLNGPPPEGLRSIPRQQNNQKD